MSTHPRQIIARTPEQLAEIRAIRERIQQEKPTLEGIEARGGQELPLGEALALQILFFELKRERERLGLTLAQLEERTGIDRATLSRLENGRAMNPTMNTVRRIAEALGKRVEYVLQDAPPADEPACPTSEQSPPRS